MCGKQACKLVQPGDVGPPQRSPTSSAGSALPMTPAPPFRSKPPAPPANDPSDSAVSCSRSRTAAESNAAGSCGLLTGARRCRCCRGVAGRVGGCGWAASWRCAAPSHARHVHEPCRAFLKLRLLDHGRGLTPRRVKGTSDQKACVPPQPSSPATSSCAASGRGMPWGKPKAA